MGGEKTMTGNIIRVVIGWMLFIYLFIFYSLHLLHL